MLLRQPGSHCSQHFHQFPHVVPQVGEARVQAEVLQTHVGQNLLVLLRRLHQEVSAEAAQVS